MMSSDKTKYGISEEFIERVMEFAAGVLNPEKLDQLLGLFQNESEKHCFTRDSESNLLRIISSLYDTRSFLSDAINYPHHIEILVAVAVNSNYLCDIIVRNPEYLYQIFNTDYLNKPISEENLSAELEEGIGKFKTFNSKLNYIKGFKRRYLLKIGLTDILFNNDVQNVTQSLSYLAKNISGKLFALCFEQIEEKYSIKCSSNYCIVSLGKLGGAELNYSSDIDLIIFYDKDETLESINKEYHEILTEAIHLFVQSSNAVTDKSFIYRVDFRLRPDGRNSPLCRSITDYFRYYETRGEDWERQMLIKLGYCGGSEFLYNEFLNFTQGFVYNSLITKSIAAKVMKMKENIEKKNSSEMNVKLFSGGIRDIEFSVQTLQLINGARLKKIRNPNTVESIKLLMESELLAEFEGEIFKSAYYFYRKIEHYLQLMNDIQTHTLPSSKDMLLKLSSYLGFETISQFQTALETHRNNVREIYLSIVNIGDGDKEASNDLSEISFSELNKANRNFAYLEKGAGLLGQKEFDSRTIELFADIKGTLIKRLKESLDPDKTLENFTKIILQVPIKSIWYSELKNNWFLDAVVQICEFNQRGIDLLIQNKSLLDLLLSRQIFRKDILSSSTVKDVTKIQLILSVNYAIKLMEPSELSKALSDWVFDKIRLVLESSNISENFFIAGLGSCGSREMGFGSDIDLLVISENTDGSAEIQNIFQRILEDFRKELKPIQVDFRLRPEGKRSQLVWDIGGYSEYIKKRILPWELQSITKIRFIEGDKKLFEKFVELAAEKVDSLEVEYLLNNVRAIYKKYHSENLLSANKQTNLKKVKGGLFDIDYTLQYLIIQNPDLFKLCLGKSLQEKGELIMEANPGLEGVAKLLENHSFLIRVELSIQNIFGINNSNLPLDERKKNLLAHFIGLKFDELNSEISANITENRKIIESILKLN